MKITIIKPDELYEVMQHLNLIKVKFGLRDKWIVAPILFATEESVDIVIDPDSIEKLETGEDVILKFQKSGYEYIVSGKTVYVGTGHTAVVSVKLLMSQRHLNLRKHMRFDTNLKVILGISDGQPIESTARNICRGGVMVVSKADLELNSFVNIQITFNSQNSFTAVARVIRKSADKENSFSYGIQFIEISEDNNCIFNKEILKYEREYLKTLDILKEYTNKTGSYFDARISILCYEADESYEIREVLVKMGAENFEVFHNFRFFADFFIEEKPKIVIVDTDNINDDIVEVIVQLTDNYPRIQVMLLMPLNDSKELGDKKKIPEGVSVLYKPLIFDELEKEIIKYL